MTLALSGLKPTGVIHLGNYLGMMRPALQLAARTDRAALFVADYHALNTVRDGGRLASLTLDVAAAFVALGLDHSRDLLYRQSDVPEVLELATVLAAVTPKGLLNRAHAYKAAVAANEAAGRLPDDGVNAGLYTYPVLMAADILVMDTDLVPVGGDQAQHVEIARDIAAAFNGRFDAVLKLPDGAIDPDVETIPGLDGRKMSKSYGNVIPLFAGIAELRRLVARIRTDSRRPEEPKDPDSCLVYRLLRHFATPSETVEMRRRYLGGEIGYREAKDILVSMIDREVGPARERFGELRPDEQGLREVLAIGADRARTRAQHVMEGVRGAIGVGPHPWPPADRSLERSA